MLNFASNYRCLQPAIKLASAATFAHRFWPFVIAPAFSFENSPRLAYFDFELRPVVEQSYLHCLHFEPASASGFVMSNRPRDSEQSELRLVAILVGHRHSSLNFRLASSSDSSTPTVHQNSVTRPASDFASLQNQAIRMLETTTELAVMRW